MTGNEYRSLRCKKHMTQEYVARLIGISRAALSGYEAERFDIPLLVALKLNRLYGIRDDEFDKYVYENTIKN